MRLVIAFTNRTFGVFRLNTDMNLFFVILARDSNHVQEKIDELEDYDVSYRVICGDDLDHPKVVHREPKGKWDAVNYSRKVIPNETDVVVFNDVDTKIRNIHSAIEILEEGSDLVYTKVKVPRGPQIKFYRIMDPIRKHLHMFACGELMLVRKKIFEEVLPVPPCLAEDSYILFKALELGYEIDFCENAWVETERTSSAEEEKEYKARTTLGIYQALEYTDPPFWVSFIYRSLPYLVKFFPALGEDGKAWKEGVERALKAYSQGVDQTRF